MLTLPSKWNASATSFALSGADDEVRDRAKGASIEISGARNPKHAEGDITGDRAESDKPSSATLNVTNGTPVNAEGSERVISRHQESGAERENALRLRDMALAVRETIAQNNFRFDRCSEHTRLAELERDEVCFDGDGHQLPCHSFHQCLRQSVPRSVPLATARTP